MRPILIVIDSLDRGGAERHVVDLAREFAARGEEVVVACSASGPLAAEVESAGVRVAVLARRKVKRRLDVNYARRLRRLVVELQPRLVHAHLYASAVAAALATARTGIPLVVTEQTEAPWRGTRNRLCSRLTYRRAQRVIAVSEAIARGAVACGARPQDVTVVRNAVRAPKPGDAHGRTATPTIGVAARLVPEKGVHVLLDAVAALRGRLPQVRLVVVGDGPLREPLERRAADLGLDGTVTFLGFRDDVPALLPSFHVLAVPSFAEGTPLTIAEAMFAGVPIVASAAGGIPEQVRHGREALLVAPGDTDGLAAALTGVLTNERLAGQLASAARARAGAEFALEPMVERVLAVYDAAAAPAAAGSHVADLEPVRVPA